MSSKDEAGSVDLKHKRSASQGSLHNNDNDSQLLSTTRQESKNRLSFKMVKQQMKVSSKINIGTKEKIS